MPSDPTTSAAPVSTDRQIAPAPDAEDRDRAYVRGQAKLAATVSAATWIGAAIAHSPPAWWTGTAIAHCAVVAAIGGVAFVQRFARHASTVDAPTND